MSKELGGVIFRPTAPVNYRPRRLLAVLAEEFTREPDKWGQGMWGHKDVAPTTHINPPSGTCCLWTGINQLMGERSCGIEAQHAAEHFIHVHKIKVEPRGPNSGAIGAVAVWNDTPGRTVQDVIDALHEAANTPTSRDP